MEEREEGEREGGLREDRGRIEDGQGTGRETHTEREREGSFH